MWTIKRIIHTCGGGNDKIRKKRGRLPVKMRLGKKNKQIVQLFPVPILGLDSRGATK